MDDNTLTHKNVRLLIVGFIAFCAILATCQTVQYKARMTSPGYRFHEIEVRIDDDNGQTDTKALQGVNNE